MFHFQESLSTQSVQSNVNPLKSLPKTDRRLLIDFFLSLQNSFALPKDKDIFDKFTFVATDMNRETNAKNLEKVDKEPLLTYFEYQLSKKEYIVLENQSAKLLAIQSHFPEPQPDSSGTPRGSKTPRSSSIFSFLQKKPTSTGTNPMTSPRSGDSTTMTSPRGAPQKSPREDNPTPLSPKGTPKKSPDGETTTDSMQSPRKLHRQSVTGSMLKILGINKQEKVDDSKVQEKEEPKVQKKAKQVTSKWKPKTLYDLMRIAEEKNIKKIESSCQSIQSSIKNKPNDIFQSYSFFNFFPDNDSKGMNEDPRAHKLFRDYFRKHLEGSPHLKNALFMETISEYCEVLDQETKTQKKIEERMVELNQFNQKYSNDDVKTDRSLLHTKSELDRRLWKVQLQMNSLESKQDLLWNKIYQQFVHDISEKKLKLDMKHFESFLEEYFKQIDKKTGLSKHGKPSSLISLAKIISETTGLGVFKDKEFMSDTPRSKLMNEIVHEGLSTKDVQSNANPLKSLPNIEGLSLKEFFLTLQNSLNLPEPKDIFDKFSSVAKNMNMTKCLKNLEKVDKESFQTYINCQLSEIDYHVLVNQSAKLLAIKSEFPKPQEKSAENHWSPKMLYDQLRLVTEKNIKEIQSSCQSILSSIENTPKNVFQTYSFLRFFPDRDSEITNEDPRALKLFRDCFKKHLEVCTRSESALFMETISEYCEVLDQLKKTQKKIDIKMLTLKLLNETFNIDDERYDQKSLKLAKAELERGLWKAQVKMNSLASRPNFLWNEIYLRYVHNSSEIKLNSNEKYLEPFLEEYKKHLDKKSGLSKQGDPSSLIPLLTDIRGMIGLELLNDNKADPSNFIYGAQFSKLVSDLSLVRKDSQQTIEQQ